ncbi:MAG TPA: hypothetical protein VHF51_01325 [Solirubrobacteraceae bacterium]|nr:hypothetical protein [Solirubrobacteraceae bacterium]
MHLKKRFLVLAAVAVVVSLTSVPTANAQSAGDSLSCAFEGLAGNISPGVRAPLDGGLQGGGTYDFAGNAVACSYTPAGKQPITNQGTAISSNGTFANLVCGTGTATGDPVQGAAGTTVTWNGAPPAGVSNIDGVQYTIVFVAGNGVLKIDKVSFTNSTAWRDVAGGGYVNISPRIVEHHVGGEPSSGNCVNEDVTAFNVTGAFSATLL